MRNPLAVWFYNSCLAHYYQRDDRHNFESRISFYKALLGRHSMKSVLNNKQLIKKILDDLESKAKDDAAFDNAA